ncbi:ATP-binding protein [Streptomyces sp. NPDC046925]|uniref:ATP-binding protein n=1 Tax=Streptomyces sp. NPDC046925 TaxID=3155375 RepID=UPI0033C08708
MSIDHEVPDQGPHPEDAPAETHTAATGETAATVSPESSVPPTPAAARAEVTKLLSSHFCYLEGEGADDVVVADALLVTTELVTNAYRHGGGLTRFSAELTDEGLSIAVGDASTRTPVVPDDDVGGASRAGGYGWLLVRRLAARVSVTCHQTGKDITALVELT